MYRGRSHKDRSKLDRSEIDLTSHWESVHTHLDRSQFAFERSHSDRLGLRSIWDRSNSLVWMTPYLITPSSNKSSMMWLLMRILKPKSDFEEPAVVIYVDLCTLALKWYEQKCCFSLHQARWAKRTSGRRSQCIMCSLVKRGLFGKENWKNPRCLPTKSYSVKYTIKLI